MILDELKNYIVDNPYCTQSALAAHFALSEDGIDAMLSIWMKKGKLKVTLTPCNKKEVRHYSWLTDQELPLTVILSA